MAFTRQQKLELHTRIKIWFEQLLGSEVAEDIESSFEEDGYKYAYSQSDTGYYDAGLWVAHEEDVPSVYISFSDHEFDPFVHEDEEIEVPLEINWNDEHGGEQRIKVKHHDSIDLVMEELEDNKEAIKSTIERELEASISFYEDEEGQERSYSSDDYEEEYDDDSEEDSKFEEPEEGSWAALQKDHRSKMFIRRVGQVLKDAKDPHIIKMLPADEKQAVIAKLRQAIEQLSEAAAAENNEKPEFDRTGGPATKGREILRPDQSGLEIDESIKKHFKRFLKG